MSVAEWPDTYSIHHWRILWSSYRKLAWVGFEPTTTKFHSEVLNDWTIRPWVQLALRANFAYLLQFHLFVFLFIYFLFKFSMLFFGSTYVKLLIALQQKNVDRNAFKLSNLSLKSGNSKTSFATSIVNRIFFVLSILFT